MWLKGSTTQRKLVKIVLLTSGASLLLACSTILTYEFLTFRQTTVQQASTLGKMIAANTTASLAFDNQGVRERFSRLCRSSSSSSRPGAYDKEGKLFSHYPSDLPETLLPVTPETDGYRFEASNLIGVQPVVQGEKRLGTLYLKWDLKPVYGRFLFYGASIIVIMAICLLAAAYALSQTLRYRISEPILGLAETARIVSNRQDYSVRAKTAGEGELGLLTEVFNQMLTRIEEQNKTVKESEQRVCAPCWIQP
jgi:methyl-accepting chemotaxis protein